MATPAEVAVGEVQSGNGASPAGDGKSSLRIEFYPFAYALFNEYLTDHCWYCLAESSALKRCTGCSCAWFCNQQCHLLGWKDHRSECKGLKNCSTVPNIEIRLLGRIVVRFKAIKHGKDKTDPNFYLHRTSKRSVMEIWAHTDRIRQDVAAMKKFEDIYKNLYNFYGEKHLVSKDEVFELHCRDFINRHAISDKAYLQEIGKGLYLDLCAYDHSCRPNSIYTCNGFIATLRGLDSSANLYNRDATFYSYIELLSSKQQRRKMLKDTWYFDCQCERCVDPTDDILTSMLCPNCLSDPEILQMFGAPPYKDPVTQMITCPKCHHVVPQEKVLEAINAMRYIDRIVEKEEVQQMPKDDRVPFLNDLLHKFSNILPSINVYFCKIIQLLILMTDPSDYKTLLELHLLSEKCVRFCFPPNHPAVAFHLRNIGIFFSRGGHPHRAQFYLEMAQDIMDFTLDPEHPMSAENRTLLEDTVKEVNQARRIILGNSELSQITRKMDDISVNKPESKQQTEDRVSVPECAVEGKIAESECVVEDDDKDLPELIK